MERTQKSRKQLDESQDKIKRQSYMLAKLNEQLNKWNVWYNKNYKQNKYATNCHN